MDIKIHTNKKHRVMGYYFSIIRALIASSKNPFDKLYYADLYCGDGTCNIIDIGKEYSPPLIQSLLIPAKNGKLNISCFLNDFSEDSIASMKIKTVPYVEFVESYYNEDANVVYKKILEQIPADQFTIFFLDPTNHKDLKWSTIEGISQHTYTQRNGSIRRPELIINFMTCTMQRCCDGKPAEAVTECLGTAEWVGEIEKMEKLGVSAPIETALLNTYKRRLESLGYKVPTPIKITSTEANSTVYYLFWATNEQGYKIIEHNVIPWMEKLTVKAQAENKAELKKADAKRQGMLPLDSYFTKSD